ncbi:MAG: chorismate synthase [Eubacterium sp.]|nr:chorismate synthase [Eubacterium sp.]
MQGSIFGNSFRVSTWGESHGKAIGVVIDGCPAGLMLNEEDIQKYLDRRKPGANKFSTPRKEADQVEILSGVFEGKTTGTPISMVVYNTSQRSGDYSEIASYYRPGHADYTFDKKYGFRDYRGGGRSSGRETISRVAAGAVAIKILEELGIDIYSYVKQVGDIAVDPSKCKRENRDQSPLCMPDLEASEKAEAYLQSLMEQGNSSGAMVECVINGLRAGIGEPVFEKLDAKLGAAIFSIGAVKGVEIGEGFAVVNATGQSNNDGFSVDGSGNVYKTTNNAGGILGGISDGSEIVVRAAFKPTPSIFSEQNTINNKKENIAIKIKGRHDPIIAPRANVVVESMVALAIIDLVIENQSSRLEWLKKGEGYES